MSDALLPKTITTKQTYNAEPQYEYTHITTFEYDDSNRLKGVLKETYRRTQNSDEDNTLVNSITRELEYSLAENIITQTDFYKTWIKANDYSTYTETRVYNIASGESNVIEVMLDGKYKETIELSNGLAVKMNRVAYSSVPEEVIFNYTEEYKYNTKGDISEYTYSANDYTNTKKYEYDSRNGVYKHLNIPQWLFISLFGDEGRFQNVKSISVMHDGQFTPFGNNANKYNRSGYVEEVVYSPDPKWVGIWGSKTTYEYINVNTIIAE